MAWEWRIVQAPMAGGASRPELAAAVSAAGGLGFLAAGYKTPEQVRQEINATQALTRRPFGVNVFVPSHDPVDDAALSKYRERLVPEAERLGVGLGDPVGGDDDWDAKISDLLADPPAVVGFTFGLPSPEVIEAFRRQGVTVVATVTSADEADQAVEAGVDALCLQGIEAGAHRGTFRNEMSGGKELLPLLTEVKARTDLPLIATGGLATAADLAKVLAAGAVAGQFGTAFLRSPESGASAVHKAALADPRFTETTLTRAFSGRPARGLVNRFLTEHSPFAPAAYPHVHNMTSPLRRAATEQGDPDSVSLWAGRSYRLATDDPAATIFSRLSEGAD